MRITLCGSTRFRDHYEALNRELSLKGHTVYSVACFGHSGDELSQKEKATLDAVHLDKIDNSEAIVVINVDGYIGDSTRREILHARSTGKMVLFLYPSWPIDLAPHGRALCRYKGCSSDHAPTPTGPCPMCYE